MDANNVSHAYLYARGWNEHVHTGKWISPHGGSRWTTEAAAAEQMRLDAVMITYVLTESDAETKAALGGAILSVVLIALEDPKIKAAMAAAHITITGTVEIPDAKPD